MKSTERCRTISKASVKAVLETGRDYDDFDDFDEESELMLPMLY